MNRSDDSPRDDLPPHERKLLDDLSRLAPRRPSPALRDRVAAALTASEAAPEPARLGRSWRWLAERLAWAGGGAVAATLLAGLAGSPAPIAVPTVPTERVAAVDPVSEQTLVQTVAAAEAPGTIAPTTVAAAPASAEAPEPVAEESLAWADEGVRYLADGVPARIYRHWVLERHPDPSGRESLLPREDVFVVPVALR